MAAAREAFRNSFHDSPTVLAVAPGRVNLIGEHTDYNDGFVLPVAIDRHVAVAASPRTDGLLVVHAAAFNITASYPVAHLAPSPDNPWANYVKGVASLLQQAGMAKTGSTLSIAGDIPRGAGLSSSAALEVAVCSALATLHGHSIDDLAAIHLCRRAEQEFAGVQCGIMDQFICTLGQRGHALWLDCRNTAFEQIPFSGEVTLVVCFTGVHRTLASSAYNLRHEECRTGVGLLAEALPSVTSLRDLTPEQFAAQEELLPPLIRRRCRHVVTENDRVLRAVSALRQNDFPGFGALMAASHESLTTDYEVSCTELDTIVEICAGTPGVYGARMTGAGFGGSAICLARPDAAENVMDRLRTIYPARTSRTPLVLRCLTEDGVSVSLP
jgi:galactokinase